MTVNRYRRWTPAEHQLIRNFAGIESAKQIAVRLGRTHLATVEQARIIGVSLQLVGERHHAAKYSDAQIERCRELRAANRPLSEIEQLTGVPRDQVWRFAFDHKRTARRRGER